VFGSDGRLKLFNPAFANMWALEQASSTTAAYRSRRSALHAALFRRRRMGGAACCRRRIARSTRGARTPSRAPRWVRARLRRSTTPRWRDPTHLHRHDRKRDVERALTERNQALSDRNQALRDAERLRNDFVHHVSYELRSPLTNIIGFIQLLDDPAIARSIPTA